MDCPPQQDPQTFRIKKTMTNQNILVRAALPALLVPLCASTAYAQQPIDESAFAQDQEPETNRPAGQEGSFPGFLGSSRSTSGFTSRFDPAFNPAIGVILDGFAIFGDAGADERANAYDRIELRAMELAMAGRFDPMGWGYVTAEFGNEGGGEYNFELLEAAVWFDQLPNNYSVRAGRFFTDFGKWNTIHIHDRPYPFEEGVRNEFFGGSLISNGVELHHWFGAGDTPVRWSLGIAPGFEGHGHPVLAFEGGEEEEGEDHHHHGFASESVGDRGFDNFALTGRITAQQDVGSNSFLQWGASAFMTDAGLLEEHDDMGMEETFELGQTTFAVDVTYRSVDEAGKSRSTGLELFLNDRDIFDEDTEEINARDAVGLQAFYEQDVSQNWGLGVQYSWWEHADKEDGGEWFSSDDAGTQLALYATWSLSEFQRLRFTVASFEPDADTDADTVFAVQWIGILGSHYHPLDW